MPFIRVIQNPCPSIEFGRDGYTTHTRHIDITLGEDRLTIKGSDWKYFCQKRPTPIGKKEGWYSIKRPSVSFVFNSNNRLMIYKTSFKKGNKRRFGNITFNPTQGIPVLSELEGNATIVFQQVKEWILSQYKKRGIFLPSGRAVLALTDDIRWMVLAPKYPYLAEVRPFTIERLFSKRLPFHKIFKTSSNWKQVTKKLFGFGGKGLASWLRAFLINSNADQAMSFLRNAVPFLKRVNNEHEVARLIEGVTDWQWAAGSLEVIGGDQQGHILTARDFLLALYKRFGLNGFIELVKAGSIGFNASFTGPHMLLINNTRPGTMDFSMDKIPLKIRSLNELDTFIFELYEEICVPVVQLPVNQEHDGKVINQFILRAPRTNREIKNWGRQLRNCLGDHHTLHIQNNLMEVYGIFTKAEDREELIGALAITKYKDGAPEILQIVGQCNGPLPESTYIENYLISKGIKLSW